MSKQSASNLSAMSLYEDIERRVTLRKGQDKAIRALASPDHKARYAFELPTGYGKTWVILAGYALLRASNRANRLLWIVPTDTQRTQADRCVSKDSKALGVSFTGSRICYGEANEIKYSNLNQAEIFVTTVHKLRSDPGYFADLMAKGEWAICCDEYHRYREDSEWGESIKSLIGNRVLIGLSGTPIRTDRKDTLFDTIDVSVSLSDAKTEGAIRGVRLSTERYTLDLTVGDEMLHLTTNNIAEQLARYGCSTLAEFDVRKQIRYHTKYISSMLTASIETMQGKQLTGKRHQMIVFAMSVAHAKSLAESIAKMNSGIRVGWVGEGPDGRDPKENAKVLDSFQSYNHKKHMGEKPGDCGIDCLVQVKKASEGFDSVYATTLVYLNLLNDRSVEADQSLGRGLRRHPEIENPDDDMCDVFVSEDSGLAAYLALLTESLNGDKPNTRDVDPDTDPKWIDIPDFFLIDVEHSGTSVAYPLGEPPKGKEQEAEAIVKEYVAKDPGVDMDLLRQAIYKVQWEAEKKPVSESDKIAAGRTGIQRCVSILAGNMVRKRFGRSYEKSAKGDMITKVNGQLKAQFGVRDTLTYSELTMAYTWLQSKNIEIGGQQELPEWAEL